MKRYRTIGSAVALLALTIGLFAPVRNFDFVELDDPLYVSENAHVSPGLTPSGVLWAFTTPHAGFYIPVVWISYMLDITVYGPGAGGHHATNVLIHACTALLLFLWLRRVTGAQVRSWVVAALFAVHPLHVESVAWITERKDVLSGLFWMLTLWTYTDYVRRPGSRRMAVVAAVFALGIMSKPSVVTLPIVLLLADAWPLGRLPLRHRIDATSENSAPNAGGRAVGRHRGDTSSIWPLVREKLPLAAMSAAGSAITLVAHSQQGAITGVATGSFRFVANAIVSYVDYLRMTVWPVNLTVLYDLPKSIPPWHSGPSILMLIGITTVIASRARRLPFLAFGWFWYLLTLLPVIGLVQAGIQARADRFIYIPSVGLFILSVWGASALLARTRWKPFVLGMASAAAIILSASAARAQIWHWKDSVALWTRATTIGLRLDEYTAHMQLGTTLRAQKRFGEANAHFLEAIRMRPSSPEGHVELALSWSAQGRRDLAIGEYRAAIELQPDLAEVHNDLGALLEAGGNLAEANHHFREAVRLKPDFEIAHLNLGLTLVKMDRIGESIAQFREAVRLNPRNQMARRALDGLSGAAR